MADRRTDTPLAPRRVLVMGGAREAHGLVTQLQALGRHVTVCLAEPERGMPPMAVPALERNFADDRDFDDWLGQVVPDGVIDAGHPFDAAISARTARICAARGIGYLRLLRPAWQPEPGDAWTAVRDVTAAAALVPAGARVFSNTGRATQAEYAGFRGAVLFLRVTEPVRDEPPFAFLRYLHGTPPFSLTQETALFGELAIDLLICRNVGGEASRAKVLAARALGIPVLMIDRPAALPGPMVHTIRDAIDWDCAQ